MGPVDRETPGHSTQDRQDRKTFMAKVTPAEQRGRSGRGPRNGKEARMSLG